MTHALLVAEGDRYHCDYTTENSLISHYDAHGPYHKHPINKAAGTNIIVSTTETLKLNYILLIATTAAYLSLLVSYISITVSVLRPVHSV